MHTLLPRQLLLIDDAVDDAHLLLEDLPADLPVRRIGQADDALDALQAALSGITGLERLYVVAHGAAGTLHLRAGAFPLQRLHTDAAARALLRSALAPDASLHLYACALAGNRAARRTLIELGQSAGIRVHAARSRLGRTGQGPRWQLDPLGRGRRESVPFSGRARQQYPHALSGPIISSGAITFTDSADNASTSFSVGQTVKVTFDGTFDSNPALTSVTVDFSNLGGPAAATATETSPGSNIWQASYTIDAFNSAPGDPLSVPITADDGILPVTAASDQGLQVWGPTITAVSATTTDGTYGAGETIEITVSLSTAIGNVTGTPLLTLETGTTDRQATFVRFAGSELTFQYVVQAGDASSDLDYTAISALSLNGGSVTDGDGGGLFIKLPAPGSTGSLGASKNIVIDAPLPPPPPPDPARVTGVDATSADGIYGEGQELTLAVQFDRAVAVTGTPTLALALDGGSAAARYLSGSGASTLLFSYLVGNGDLSADLDYQSIGALSGSILATSGAEAILTLPAPGNAGSLASNRNLVIDGVPPALASLALTTVDGRYRAGDTLSIDATFSEAVTVSGAPTLTLTIGERSVSATLAGGDGSDTLRFEYVVQPGDNDADGITLGALQLPDGSTLTDAAGNDAVLSGATITASPGVIIDTLAPVVTQLTPPDAGRYGSARRLDIAVALSEAVNIDTTGGTPVLLLQVGDQAREAFMVGQAATGELLFSYFTRSGDVDTDGVQFSAIEARGARIVDDAGNAADLSLAQLSIRNGVLVDTTQPRVLRVSTSMPDGIYRAGDEIIIEALLSEPVRVRGEPLLLFDLGGTTRAMRHVGPEISNTLSFVYTIQAGDESENFALSANARVDLNGGSIVDLSDNPALLEVTGPGVDNRIGTDSNIVIVNTPPDDDRDGVSNETEDRAPGFSEADIGDGNGDDTPDAEQQDVASVPFLDSETAESNPEGAEEAFITIVADADEGKIDLDDDNEAEIIGVDQHDTPADVPIGSSTPFGEIEFEVDVGQAGITETFSLYLDADTDINGFWVQDNDGRWINLASPARGGGVVIEGDPRLANGFVGAVMFTEDGRLRLDFQITDGGPFDGDSEANGIIVVTGMPALIVEDLA